MGKVDRKWSTQDCVDQTKFMDLLIDPNRDSAKNMGQPPAAVMISRMLYVHSSRSALVSESLSAHNYRSRLFEVMHGD